MRRQCGLGLGIAVGILAFGVVLGWAGSNDECMSCHSPDNAASADAPAVDAKTLANSVHSRLTCAFCHTDATPLPHDADLQPVDPQSCDRCHEDANRTYQKSVHGQALRHEEHGMAVCSDCHGTHDIKSPDNPQSRVFPFNLPKTCGQCHADAQLAAEHNIPVPDAYQSYMSGVHGKGLSQSGLLFAANCNDCHGSHLIFKSSNPKSKIHPSNVMETCGNCHQGVIDDYRRSVHAKQRERGNENAPLCTDCHRTHGVANARASSFELAALDACGSCHQAQYQAYLKTYHGQMAKLGYPDVATCADCHGEHATPSVGQAATAYPEEEILKTCRRCHTRASADIVSLTPHPVDEAGPLLTFSQVDQYAGWAFGLLAVGLVVHLAASSIWGRPRRWVKQGNQQAEPAPTDADHDAVQGDETTRDDDGEAG
ncbi:MAG: hypothetical protein ABEK03_05410 [Candidatus Bipolaricaulia bacterium]